MNKEHYCRHVMNEDITNFVQYLDFKNMDAIEISGSTLSKVHWKSYQALHFPDFDLLNPKYPEKKFDIVICQQVLEHVKNPFVATQTLSNLLKNDGTLIVSTPFMLKIHAAPNDYWRFTKEGMAILLESAGLRKVAIKSWGSRYAVKLNFNRWAKKRWYQPLQNEEDFPLVVWAFASK